MTTARLWILAAYVLGLTAWCIISPRPAPAQVGSPSDLQMVLIVTRHGVRSPTHPAELAAYASQPWPKWPVPGGYLTERGALLMRQFGQHYRAAYAGTGVLPSSGCPAADSVFVWADVDERTRVTAESLLSGLAPDCGIAIGHAAGDGDPLFDPLPSLGTVDAAKSYASLMGSIGGDPNALAQAYHAQLASLDAVLGCGSTGGCKQLSQVPTTVTSTGDGKLAEMSGGFDLAATAAENLLLEYTDGQKVVGWGRLDRQRLLGLLQIHTVKSRLAHENLYAAQAHSSNILAHILQTIQQGASGAKVSGTRVPVQSRFVMIVGHDTQLSELAGLLHLSWLMPGYQLNDTPPGGALVFEVHGAPASAAEPFVRLFFTAQSMDAMRSGEGSNPGRVAVYVPGCPSLDCPLTTFTKVVNSAVDPSFVGPWQ